ncbi:hypothetical protein DsansV1_C02g0016681 [Dioscorea sansibarensis]
MHEEAEKLDEMVIFTGYLFNPYLRAPTIPVLTSRHVKERRNYGTISSVMARLCAEHCQIVHLLLLTS